MSELITRTARLVPYAKRPKQVPSFVTAYFHEPLPDDPGFEMGSFYVVLEVLISGRASEEVADIIIETVGDTYYNQAAENDDALSRFEAAIRATNHELAEHVNRGNAAWIGKLSAVIAMQAGPELHIASTGSAEAFLYRGPASTRITADGNTKASTPSKTFGSIATGQLEAGDRVLLATPALVHQVPLTKLQSIISHTSPNAAIAELTELLKGPSATERVAALIIEVTTPEMAALQVRSEQPSDVQIGAPENAFEAAKLAAAPIAHTTASSGKKLATAAHHTLKRAQPHARAFGLAAADRTRTLLSTKKGRRLALAGLIIILAASIALVLVSGSSVRSSAIFSKYQSAYASFSNGQKQLDAGKKTEARSSLNSAKQQLSALTKDENTINLKLAHMALPEGEPRTYSGLTSLVADRIDQLDGLVRTAPTTVASLAKSAHLTHFEIAAGKAYVFNAADKNSISIISLADGSSRTSAAATSKLGTIVATTLASDNTGIYVLTKKPDVWFYRFASDTLAEQKPASGDWPVAIGAASYASNLYLLTSSAVYKYVRYSSSFSAKTLYIGLTNDHSSGASSIAVDGSVYLATTSELQLYQLGVLEQSLKIPASLPGVTGLRSEQGAQKLSAVSPKTNRIGFWNLSNKSLSLDKQILATGVTALYDCAVDAHSGILYGVADNRLVRFSVQP